MLVGPDRPLYVVFYIFKKSPSVMPRNRKRTTDRGKNFDNMEKAAKKVLIEKMSIREVAKQYEICHVSLYRYCKKKQKFQEGTMSEPPRTGYNPHNRVFNPEQETTLVEYLLKAADLYYGLTPKEVRRTAYRCALASGIKIPAPWTDHEMAGADWFADFLRRHPQLAIRKPQATSLARATAFNETTVDEFFTNLEDVMKRFKFETQNIYNMDETGSNPCPYCCS
jgi:transposase